MGERYSTAKQNVTIPSFLLSLGLVFLYVCMGVFFVWLAFCFLGVFVVGFLRVFLIQVQEHKRIITDLEIIDAFKFRFQVICYLRWYCRSSHSFIFLKVVSVGFVWCGFYFLNPFYTC